MSQSEEIKSRLDIVDVISSYLSLEKAGINFRARCPFHNEKTPSFFVSPSRQSWKCFGCNEGGDIYTFIEKMEGVDFLGALEILAQRAGVVLKKTDAKQKGKIDKLFAVCASAMDYFSDNLRQNKNVFDYLFGRNVSKDSIDKFKIGFSKSEWRGLFDYLVKIGYRPEDIERAGLIIRKQIDPTEELEAGNYKLKTSYYDRFRSRIIFPIFDVAGRIAGFGGRDFSSEAESQKIGETSKAKYINTPQTEIYNKGKILYGLNFAKTEIRKKGFCIVVEGYMDLIAMHQAGFSNTVAVSGTALTKYHLQILKRYSENLVFAFDSDSAGENAAFRGINMAQSLGFGVKLLILPDGKDPSEFLQKHEKEEMERYVGEACSAMEFYFQKTFKNFDPKSAEDKKRVVDFLIPKIKIIRSGVKQSHWLRELSSRLFVPEEILRSELENYRIKDYYVDYYVKKQEIKNANQIAKRKDEHIGEKLAVWFLKYPKHIGLALRASLEYFSDDFLLKPFFLEIREKGAQEESLRDRLINALGNRSEDLIFESERLGSDIEIAEREIEREIKLCLRELEKHFLGIAAEKLDFQIQMSERENKDTSEFVTERQKILEKLSKLFK